jgi:hypothetical protein
MEYLCNTNVVIDKNVVLNSENIYVMTNLKRNGIHSLLRGIFHIMSYQPETHKYAMNIQNDVIGLVLRHNCKSKQVTDFIA